MALISLQTLIDDSKGRADMIGSTFVSDALWKTFINAGLGDLYDLLVSAYGDDYFTQYSSVVDVAQGAGEAPLPTDFYKLTGLEFKHMGKWKPMIDFQFAEASLISEDYRTPRYCVQANKILIRPESHPAVQIRYVYVPEFIKLVSVSDTFNFKSSWDDFVVLKAAIKARDKEESDVSVLVLELQRAEANIIKMAPKRDANRPKKVIDVESVNLGVANAW